MTCSCGCGTCDETQGHFQANLSNSTRRATYKGREHIVAPVVMLRETVVNKALVTKDELKPHTWNGTPVTLNHPSDGSGFISANAPNVLQEVQVGTVFNCYLDGDKLKGEAWIDIADAERVYPGLVSLLEQDVPMNVSTGYFYKANKAKGIHKSKPYTAVHSDLVPDHFALLPEDVGACSWADGCGVRTNSEGVNMPEQNTEDQVGAFRTLLSLFGKPAANARGNADDRGQIVADLISNDSTPFLPDDMYLLMDMRTDALHSLRDQYLPANPAANEATQTGGSDVTDENKAGAAAPAQPAGNSEATVANMTVAALTELVANAATAAATQAIAANAEQTKRADLTKDLAANESLGFTTEELDAMPLSALEKLAANAAKKPATNAAPVKRVNFGGRAVATNADQGTSQTKYPGMTGQAPASAAGEKE